MRLPTGVRNRVRLWRDGLRLAIGCVRGTCLLWFNTLLTERLRRRDLALADANGPRARALLVPILETSEVILSPVL